eukprot:CAMPEP_0117602914 /NCGR_PEP_ID=MMETSP0784-20121206/77843_1 /TAXON_ID=39447 /ORGANISM="" /LENGTH=37 /DNA_ID= /DNA_START= /DNA_END= /DNA_ORIENTATION=
MSRKILHSSPLPNATAIRRGLKKTVVSTGKGAQFYQD